MELLSVKQPPADINGKEAHSMDNLLQERSPVPTKTKGWGSKRKKSTSLDTDVFIGESMCTITLLKVHAPLKYLIGNTYCCYCY